MRAATLIPALSLVASVALADIAPPDSTQCRTLRAGAACRTDDGRPGTCVAKTVSRLDYSEGVPPKTKQVEVLLCLANASAKASAPSRPALLAGGALLVMVLAAAGLELARRGRRSLAA